jgi:FkbM family methyltransferase
MDIAVIDQQSDWALLRFNGQHSFWFPRQTPLNLELWNEYLAVFWRHQANAHYYLRSGAVIEMGDIVYDCGACEGFFARLALEKGAKLVVCFEPSQFMAACLKRTFSREIAEGRVIIHELALSSVAGRAPFSQTLGEAFTGKLMESGVDSVELTTLDALAGKGAPPDFIKMDLEGTEYEALRGGVTTLAQGHPKLAVTTYHYPWDYAVSRALISSFGYDNIRCSAATMRQSNIPRSVMLHAWSNVY